MSDTESFEQAMEIARHVMCEECELIDDYGSLCRAHDDSCHKCEESMVARLRAAHNREIRDVAQQAYHRGFEDGRHSMDAEHRAVAMRLRGLRFDGGSHENLARIAYAIYPCATGWTCESAAGLRDRLIDLLGGVSDDTCDSQCCGACDADCGDDFREQTEVSDGRCEWLRDGTTSDSLIPVWHRAGKDGILNDGRVADDCGGDTGGSYRGVSIHLDGLKDDGTSPNDDPTSSITDELRKWASDRHCKGISHTDVLNIGLIADRIDAQFDRICQQQEAVLQSTIDGMVKEYEHDRLPDQLRIEKLENQRDHWHQQATDMMNHADAMEHERDELQAKLDEATHDVEMWRDRAEDMRMERDELQAKLDAIRDSLDG